MIGGAYRAATISVQYGEGVLHSAATTEYFT
jgi:hypothetical protein